MVNHSILFHLAISIGCTVDTFNSKTWYFKVSGISEAGTPGPSSNLKGIILTQTTPPSLGHLNLISPFKKYLVYFHIRPLPNCGALS